MDIGDLGRIDAVRPVSNAELPPLKTQSQRVYPEYEVIILHLYDRFGRLEETRLENLRS